MYDCKNSSLFIATKDIMSAASMSDAIDDVVLLYNASLLFSGGW